MPRISRDTGPGPRRARDRRRAAAAADALRVDFDRDVAEPREEPVAALPPVEREDAVPVRADPRDRAAALEAERPAEDRADADRGEDPRLEDVRPVDRAREGAGVRVAMPGG